MVVAAAEESDGCLLQAVVSNAMLAVERPVDFLQYGPRLIVGEVRAELLYVFDSPDMGDQPILGQEAVQVDFGFLNAAEFQQLVNIDGGWNVCCGDT